MVPMLDSEESLLTTDLRLIASLDEASPKNGRWID